MMTYYAAFEIFKETLTRESEDNLEGLIRLLV